MRQQPPLRPELPYLAWPIASGIRAPIDMLIAHLVIITEVKSIALLNVRGPVCRRACWARGCSSACDSRDGFLEHIQADFQLGLVNAERRAETDGGIAAAPQEKAAPE